MTSLTESGSLHGLDRLVQQKTSRPVQFEITESTRTALTDWIKLSGLASDGFLFPSRVHASPHLSTRQYARIVDSWVEEIGLDPAAYGTHSIRRTKPALIYRRTKNLRAVQLLLGHTKLESTVRYLASIERLRTPLELAEQSARGVTLFTGMSRIDRKMAKHHPAHVGLGGSSAQIQVSSVAGHAVDRGFRGCVWGKRCSIGLLCVPVNGGASRRVVEIIHEARPARPQRRGPFQARHRTH